MKICVDLLAREVRRIPSSDFVALVENEAINETDRIEKHAQKSDHDRPQSSKVAKFVHVVALISEQHKAFFFVIAESLQ